MTRPLFALAMLVLAACNSETSSTAMSREPVSVRGWILDVKGAQRAENMDLEIARRTTLFQSTSVWVEGTEYASGGVAENGGFIVLDVPPGNPILGFNAPGAETGRVMMEGVPGTADVFIPDLILEPNGATVLDPKKIVVRLAADVEKPTPTGRTAKVAGYTVPIINAPYSQMMDRRDYPKPPGYRPVATIR
ncbi:MAG TPA: hypothetical protein VGQ76_23465 [Thermoanaerobaculia bacterium]|jgi:hypothetical protein|nr:hypothetical protein [Thermoanaerobaculia bacterium]